MPDTPTPDDNRILAGAEPDARERLDPHLELVDLAFGESVLRTGQPLENAYFPTTAVFSLMRYTSDGDVAEVALTGDEGVVGVDAFLGRAESTCSALIKRAGLAWRVDAEVLRDVFTRGGRIRTRLLNYTQALVAQLLQTGVCNRLHNTDERLCRCLLQLRDRQHSDRMEITHEFLSHILGGRRVGVTQALGQLQNDGVIASTRGCIELLDRAAMERRACECYSIIREDTERLAPG